MTLTLQASNRRSVSEAVVRAYGRGRRVELLLDDTLPIPQLENGLRAYMRHTDGRFAGGKIVLNLGQRLMEAHQLERLKGILEREFSLHIESISCAPSVLANSLSTGVPIPPSFESSFEELQPATVLTEATDGKSATLLVKGTCRSGTVVHNNGNVVILGDVNPGAEVTAAGDIVVFGSLRGLAHADFVGLGQRIVVALSIETTQLRIGPYVHVPTRSRTQRRQRLTPEMALVKGGGIVVQPYGARHLRK